MQDKLNKIKEKISFYTTNPDNDWKRLFVYIVIAVLLVMVWSLYFYLIVKKDIHDSEVIRTPRSGGVVLESENDLQSVISSMEAKKEKNLKIIEGSTSTISIGNPL